MTWKIDKYSDGQRTTILLIGRMREQHLRDVQILIAESKPTIIVDPEELMLMNLEAVRFLGRCQNEGVLSAPLLAIHQGLDRKRTRQSQPAIADCRNPMVSVSTVHTVNPKRETPLPAG